MNDVDKISKINSMSQELKRFGFSSNTHEAIEGASNILLSEDEKNESSVFSDNENAIIELNNKFGRFKDLATAKIQELCREVTTLQEQIRDLNQRTHNFQKPQEKEEYKDQLSPQTNNRNELPPQRMPSPEISKTQSQEGRNQKPYYEKQGHFTPEDVKIEDIFYYGQR